MQIVTQSASILYSLFPPMPLLPAPQPQKLLCAPKIAGLLPAQVTRHVDITLDTDGILDTASLHAMVARLPKKVRDALGPIKSREEMDAELLAIKNRPIFVPNIGRSRQ